MNEDNADNAGNADNKDIEFWFKLCPTPKSQWKRFEVNLPTPGPSLEKGGERGFHVQQQDLQYFAGAEVPPLPAGREGLGVGRLI